MDNCAIPACANPIKRRDLCYAHYMKWWRYGTATPTHPNRHDKLEGKRFGTLVAQERVGQAWACICDCGNTRTVSTGDLNRYGDSSTCGTKRNHLAAVVDYPAAHARVRSARGPASSYPCSNCGHPALHWSYNHDDPRELISPAGTTQGLAYSLKAEHYSPRCVPCHKRFDLDHIASTNFDRIYAH